MEVIKTNKPYIRKFVFEDNKSMYIFTDNNIDRNSGKTLIPILRGIHRNTEKININTTHQ